MADGVIASPADFIKLVDGVWLTAGSLSTLLLIFHIKKENKKQHSFALCKYLTFGLQRASVGRCVFDADQAECCFLLVGFT